MLSRQLVKQLAKAAAAKPCFASKRFSHDAHFPAKVPEVHFHEAVDYLGFNAPYPEFDYATNPGRYSAEKARLVYDNIPQATQYYKSLTDVEDQRLFASIILNMTCSEAIVEKITGKRYVDHFDNTPVEKSIAHEADLFRYGLLKETPAFSHGGICEVLIKPFLKFKPLSMISVIALCASTAYMTYLTVYAIRAYFDGLIYDHHDEHEHAEHH